MKLGKLVLKQNPLLELFSCHGPSSMQKNEGQWRKRHSTSCIPYWVVALFLVQQSLSVLFLCKRSSWRSPPCYPKGQPYPKMKDLDAIAGCLNWPGEWSAPDSLALNLPPLFSLLDKILHNGKNLNEDTSLSIGPGPNWLHAELMLASGMESSVRCHVMHLGYWEESSSTGSNPELSLTIAAAPLIRRHSSACSP